MNLITPNRFLKPLLTTLSVTMTVIIVALSIELLYQGFQFIEIAFQASSRQADQYFLQLAYRN